MSGFLRKCVRRVPGRWGGDEGRALYKSAGDGQAAIARVPHGAPWWLFRPVRRPLVPGLTRFDPVRIERQLDPRDTLFDDWVKQVDQGSGFRRNLVVTLLDAERNPVKSWRLQRCWPTAHLAFSQLDGLGHAIVVEALTLAVEAWEPRS